MTTDTPAGKGWTHILSGLFGAAGGALMTSILEVAKNEPLAVVIVALSFLLLALLVAIGASFLAGQWVHIRELDRVVEAADERIAEYKQDRDRVAALLPLFADTTQDALMLAKQGEAKP